MTARKKGNDGWRVPASELESLVEDRLNLILSDQAQLADWIHECGYRDQIEKGLAAAEQHKRDHDSNNAADMRTLLRRAFHRIELGPGTIKFQVDRNSIVTWLVGAIFERSQPCPAGHQPPSTVTVPIAIKRRGVETRMVLTNGGSPSHKPDPALIQPIAKAHS